MQWHNDRRSQWPRPLCYTRLGPKTVEVAARHCIGNITPKIWVVYFSPIWHLIRSDQSNYLVDRVPILSDLNAKHTDWESSLITARDLLLHDYANANFCLTCGMNETL